MSVKDIASIDIDAPPEVVWEVLTDVGTWKEWSSLLHYDGGIFALGNRVRLKLSPPDGGGYAFTPEVFVLDAPSHMAWVGRTGVADVFDGEHHFRITPRDGGCTLTHQEKASGLLTPLIQEMPAMQGVRETFATINREVKARAEALAADRD